MASEKINKGIETLSWVGQNEQVAYLGVQSLKKQRVWKVTKMRIYQGKAFGYGLFVK